MSRTTPKPVLTVLANRGYLDQAKQVFASAVVYGGWQHDRLLLTDEADAPGIEALKAAGIQVHAAAPCIDEETWNRRCRTVSIRLNILKFELFGRAFAEWSHVLYLDADTMVTGPIEHLSRVRGFWAVRDHDHQLQHNFHEAGVCLPAGFQRDMWAFNAGMFAFSRDAVEPDARERLCELMDRYLEQSVWADQGPLNLYWYSRWNRLPAAYNYFPYYARASTLANTGNASILHFAGQEKPWVETSVFRQRWLDGLRRFGEEGPPSSNFWGRLLAQGHRLERVSVAHSPPADHPTVYRLARGTLRSSQRAMRWPRSALRKILRASYRLALPHVATRLEIPHLLNARGLVGQGVEVCVQRGEYSDYLLRAWRGQRLTFVDPWLEQERYNDISNVPQLKQNELYGETCELLRTNGERSVVAHKTSVDAAPRFADGQLDFVYIDARHDYESVCENLRLWTPKVRAGGLVAGHDYLDGVTAIGTFGVKRAVDEHVARLGVRLYVTREEHRPSWMFFQPAALGKTYLPAVGP